MKNVEHLNVLFCGQITVIFFRGSFNNEVLGLVRFWGEGEGLCDIL